MTINKFTLLLLCWGLSASLLSSCSYIMNEPKENTRIPQPPPGTTERSKPWNESQKFEAEAVLGPLANPRR